MISLADVHAAAERIAPYVRRTPVLEATRLKRTLGDGTVVLKLESLQVTGSFKARGASSKLTSLKPDALERGLVTASGGNHGLAVAYAAWLAGVPASIFLPGNASPAKLSKLETWGARVELVGKVWDEANRAAQEVAARDGLTYVHPFADPAVVAGQGTVAAEALEQDPDIDEFLVAIGGGGLISGMAVAAKALKPSVRIVGIEPVGAPTLHESVRAGYPVELDAVTTCVPTMAARQTDGRILDLVRTHVDDIVLVSDDDMRHAAAWLWFEMGVAADLSGAAAVAALLSGRVANPAGRRICALVCGAGPEAIDAARTDQEAGHAKPSGDPARRSESSLSRP